MFVCLSQQNYTCRCNPSYKGIMCHNLVCIKGAPEGSDEVKECYGAGSCVNGKCECYSGYSGVACADKEVRGLHLHMWWQLLFPSKQRLRSCVELEGFVNTFIRHHIAILGLRVCISVLLRCRKIRSTCHGTSPLKSM